MKPVSETVNPSPLLLRLPRCPRARRRRAVSPVGLVSQVASADADGERGPGLPPLRFVMSPERSHAHVLLGHQLYPILEQCRKPEALWDKLATGNYDWLGVRRNGKYVLG